MSYKSLKPKSVAIAICFLIVLGLYFSFKCNLQEEQEKTFIESDISDFEDDENLIEKSGHEDKTEEHVMTTSEHPTKHNTVKKIKPGAVLLVTQYRSGSSFVGEIFNQRRGVAYFYEPLYPLGPCPSKRDPGVAEYFQHVLRFDFTGAHALYKKTYPSSGRKQDNGCLAKGICFADCPKCSRFLSRDVDICRSKGGQHVCPRHLNLEKVSEAVQRSSHIAFKVVYLCNFSMIMPILEDPELNVKIVHLVRDPRAILKSRLDTAGVKITQEFSRSKAEHLCDHLNDLLESAKELTASDRYMRVRHEDFALDPLHWTKTIYQFANITLNQELIDWLKKATSSQNSKGLSSSQAFTTTRNSADTVMRWRKDIAYEDVMLIQSLCKRPINELKYIPFDNIENLRNYNISSYSLLEA